VATPITGLRAGASFDLLDINDTDDEIYSVAGYLSYQATEKLSFHARAEYFRDRLDDNGPDTRDCSSILQAVWAMRRSRGSGAHGHGSV